MFQKQSFLRLLVCLCGLAVAQARRETSLLMIGNSFSDANNVEEELTIMLKENLEYNGGIHAMRFREGSTRFDDDAKNEAIHSTISERSWTWVVLQEQSQIPGLFGTSAESEFEKSLDAAEKLNEWITASNSEAILLMTWGQRAADPMNPILFHDFPTMQDRLRLGYLKLQERVSTPEHPVRIAPVGLAFKQVYDSISEGQPNATGTLFHSLYEEDGKHPSATGSYLIAATLYGTLSGKDPLGIKYRPREISLSQQHDLLGAASRAVTSFRSKNEINKQYWENSKKNANNQGGESGKKGYVPPDEQKQNNSSRQGHGLWVVFAGIVLAFGITKGGRVLSQQSQRTMSRRYHAVNSNDANMELIDVPQGGETPF